MPFGFQPLQITKYYYWFLKGGYDFYICVIGVCTLPNLYQFFLIDKLTFSLKAVNFSQKPFERCKRFKTLVLHGNTAKALEGRRSKKTSPDHKKTLIIPSWMPYGMPMLGL